MRVILFASVCLRSVDLRSNQEKGAAARAVRSDHECLLDVGRLGWPGDEDAESGALESNPIIGLLHGIDNLAGWHDQNKVLGHHEDRPMGAERASRYPHGAVLGDTEFAGKDGDVDPLEFVRIFERGEIDVGPTYVRNQ